MPNLPEASRKAASQARGMRISLPWRAATLLLGLTGLGSGGAAVFVTHLEAGPVALLVIGLVLLLIGIGGQLPSRLRVGDNEAAWDAVETFVERLAADAPPNSRADLMDALDDLAEAAPALAGPAISVIAYEHLILEMLAATVSRLNQQDETLRDKPGLTLHAEEHVTTQLGDVIAAAERADAVISTASGRNIAVEISGSSRGVTTATVSKLAAWLDPQVSETPMIIPSEVRASSVLLITRENLMHQKRTVINNLSHRLVHVVVRGTQDDQNLYEAVIEVLRRAEPGA